MKKYILGIDNGGTVTKAAIYNLEGQVLAIASNTTRMITPKPFFTERDIEELWQSNLLVIKEVLKKSVIDAADIIGISVTGHGNGLYLVDEQENPLVMALFQQIIVPKNMLNNGINHLNSKVKFYLKPCNQFGQANLSPYSLGYKIMNLKHWKRRVTSLW